jgi:hypothetical protein
VRLTSRSHKLAKGKLKEGAPVSWAGPAGVKEGLEIGPRPDLKLWKKVDARFRFRV